MKIEERIQQKIEEIKAEWAERDRLAREKDIQKHQAIEECRAVLVRWLTGLGIEESALTLSNAETMISYDQLKGSILVSGVHVEFVSYAQLVECDRLWKWNSPPEKAGFSVGIHTSRYCVSVDELSDWLVECVAKALLAQDDLPEEDVLEDF